ncbi:OsmC family protein [Sphingomonas sp. NBWT7]|uniref:OsmC family protein n=1 Tax=Sphingomonas sp. NBWT7 TaxID=2596913 RepID=UPI0021565B31|nr:hypothetical protein [Sphingomonas sp. NBWT7]
MRCSNHPRLGGDPALHNPEDLLIAALSACRMLWYLHLASAAGIAVSAYADDPLGHGEIAQVCFIARSVKFSVRYAATYINA